MLCCRCWSRQPMTSRRLPLSHGHSVRLVRRGRKGECRISCSSVERFIRQGTSDGLPRLWRDKAVGELGHFIVFWGLLSSLQVVLARFRPSTWRGQNNIIIKMAASAGGRWLGAEVAEVPKNKASILVISAPPSACLQSMCSTNRQEASRRNFHARPWRSLMSSYLLHVREKTTRANRGACFKIPRR